MREPYTTDQDFFEHTGFLTHEELSAYEKGREDEASVWLKFIRDWKGESNSVLGQTLTDKVKEFTLPKTP